MTWIWIGGGISTDYNYDLDGNITLMSRNGVFERTAGGLSGGGLGGITLGGSPGLGGSSIQPASKTYANVDNICLSYEGGQLVRADDAGWDCTLSIATDWSEQTQTAREYTYDADGRMTSDKNKGITSVTYNVLGLSETLTTASGVIRNTYDADGRLVRRSYGTLEWVTTDLGFTSHTYQAYREERRVDYVGELTLEDGAVYRRTHEAGWTDAQGREVAAVHDYRGSLRATWTDTSTGNATGGGGPFIPGASAGTKIYGNLTGYYPYGLPWADWQGTDRYLFSGKEFEREHGLFTYDFHARPYDPGLCRFTQPDPMATKYERLNAFTYCAANPISFTDPTGCVIKAANEESQMEMLNDLKKIYKEEFAEIGFDKDTGNLFVNLHKENISDKETLKHINQVDKLVQKLINKNDTYTVNYVDGDVEIDGTTMDIKGGYADVDNKSIYITKGLDMEFWVMPDNNNPELSSMGLVKVRETSASTLLHEFKEMDLGHKNYRGAVIDYSNHGRILLGLPKRYYDVDHSHTTKTKYY